MITICCEGCSVQARLRSESELLTGIRADMKRKGERQKTALFGFQNAIVKTAANWPRASMRLVGRSIAAVTLAMAMAACGGNSESTHTSEVAPAANDKAELAAAVSAANLTSIPLAMSLKMNTSSIAPDSETDRFIVKYKTGSVERDSASSIQTKLDKLRNAFPAGAHHLRRMGIGSDVLTTERKLNGKDAKVFMQAIASDPNVEYVEPDTPVSIALVPNDPFYADQWAYSPSTRTNNPALYGIRAEGAWDISNGSGVTIAMVDNGVSAHSDLDANILPGTDFSIGNRGSGDGRNPGLERYTCGITWHGTHVAGILAAVSNNSKGVAGTASGAKVVSVRVLNGCGNGLMSDVADGITWAAGGSVPGVQTNNFPAKVINVSVSGKGYCSFTYQNAVNYATGRGASVVVAAGNNSADVSAFQPASCGNVIVVGNSNFRGGREYASNFGSSVDVAAPGENIWSTYNLGNASPGEESYLYMTGTSMSAPFVSGVIALAQAVAPTPLTMAEIRTLLTQNTQAFAGQPDHPIGTGILNAAATVLAAKSGRIPAAADFSCTQMKNVMSIKCQDLSTSRGAPIVSRTWNWGTGKDRTTTEALNLGPLDFEYAGTYYMTLKVTESTGAVSTLVRPVQIIAPYATNLNPNIPVPIVGSSGDLIYYSLQVPAGVKSLKFQLSEGSGGAYVYVRRDTPSLMTPLCTTLYFYNAANCTLDSPQAGTYYVMLEPIGSLSNATLVGSYSQ